MSLPFLRHRGLQAGIVWSGWLSAGDDQRIEINLHLLFPLTVFAVAALLAQALFPRIFPGWTASVYWLVAATVAVMDGLTALLHELAHAGVAVVCGKPVSRITLYGVAAAVRRSSGKPRHSADQVLIAIAGPLSHLLVASALVVAWNMLPYDNEPLRVAAGFPALSNFVAGIFNLLPVSQLDGARAARGLTAVVARSRPAPAG
ncbi:MAG: M50 family metallopeptidase [Chloroflexota bacterium]